MLSLIVRLLRLASLVICLIVLASFAVFAVNQTSSASTRQQEKLPGGGPTATGPGASGSSKTSSPPHESTVHKTLDEASDELTSPFAGLVSGSSSQWLIHIVKTALALLVYGFGLSFLARVIRVRV